MNNLQKYIDLLKSEKSRAVKGADKSRDAQKWHNMEKWQERESAIDFCLHHAELLLNLEDEKQR